MRFLDVAAITLQVKPEKLQFKFLQLLFKFIVG